MLSTGRPFKGCGGTSSGVTTTCHRVTTPVVGGCGGRRELSFLLSEDGSGCKTTAKVDANRCMTVKYKAKEACSLSNPALSSSFGGDDVSDVAAPLSLAMGKRWVMLVLLVVVVVVSLAASPPCGFGVVVVVKSVDRRTKARWTC